jgi:hypothetical protein
VRASRRSTLPPSARTSTQRHLQDAIDAKKKADHEAPAKPAPVKSEGSTSGAKPRQLVTLSDDDDDAPKQDGDYYTPNSKGGRGAAAQRTPTPMYTISRTPTDAELTDHMKRLQVQARAAAAAKGAPTTTKTERKHGLFSRKVPGTNKVQRSPEGYLVRRPPNGAARAVTQPDRLGPSLPCRRRSVRPLWGWSTKTRTTQPCPIPKESGDVFYSTRAA